VKQIRKLVNIIGFSGILGMAIMFYIMFFGTYLTGFHSTMDINSIGEATPELVLFTFCIVLGFIVWINYIRREKMESETKTS
jgi:hypothetical protein